MTDYSAGAIAPATSDELAASFSADRASRRPVEPTPRVKIGFGFIARDDGARRAAFEQVSCFEVDILS